MALPGQSTARAEPDPRHLWRYRGKITGPLPDDELLAMVHQKAGTGDHGVDPMHLVLQKQWFINIVHMVGLQSYDSYNLFEDIDPNFVFTDDTYIANHLVRYMMSGASRLVQSKPDWDVTPRSPDQEDQEAAKVAQRLLDYAYQHHNLDELRTELAFWLQACGTSFLCAEWDESLGPKQRAYKDPFSEGMLSAGSLDDDAKAFLERVGAVEKIQEGDAVLEHCSPFQVLLPHSFTKMSEMPWLVIKHRRSIDWVWDHYEDKAEEVTVDDIATNKDGQYWDRLSTLTNRHGFTIPSRGAENMDQVEILQLWVPPSNRVPKGIHGVITNNVVLKNDVHPFAKMGIDLRFPLIDFHYCPVPGRFWSMGMLEHMIGPQREYNRGRGQVIQHRDTLAVPQWMAPEQCELTNTRNDTGDLWEYRGGFGRPELVNPPAMSQIHIETINRAIDDMQQISAQSDVTQAQVPQGVRSGTAIRALKEADYQVIGVPVQNMERGFTKVGTALLQLYWKNMKTPRAVEVYGEDRMSDISYFKGADIRGNTTVVIVQGSMMPKSKAETQELLMDMMQMGALDPATNPRHARIVYRALEIGGTDKMFLEEQLDQRRANIENRMFHKPQPGVGWPRASDHDDHQVHLEEHRLFMKTDTYELLPPMRKIAFEKHLLEHEQGLMLMAESLIAMQGPMGMAGGAGGGSPPAEKGKPSPPGNKQPTPGSQKSNEL